MYSCHTALDRGLAPRPGPATAALRQEHDVILRALGVLERAGRRLAAGHRVNEAALKELVGLLRTLADQCHHGKEEGFLFPAMKEKGIPPEGPIGVMLAEHSEGRDYLATLSSLPSPGERAAAALLYVQLLRAHIEKENMVLFAMADELFSPAEHDALARCYAEVELRSFGAGFQEKVLAQLERLETAIPA